MSINRNAGGRDSSNRDRDVDSSQLVCTANYAGYIAIRDYVKRQKTILRADQNVAPYVKIARLNKMQKAVIAVCKCPFPITSKSEAKSIEGIGDSFAEIIYSAIQLHPYDENDPDMNRPIQSIASQNVTQNKSGGKIDSLPSSASSNLSTALPSSSTTATKRKRSSNNANKSDGDRNFSSSSSSSSSSLLYSPVVGKVPWAVLLSLFLLDMELIEGHLIVDGSSFSKSDVVEKCVVIIGQFPDLRNALLSDSSSNSDGKSDDIPAIFGHFDEANDKFYNFILHNWKSTVKVLRDKELITVSAVSNANTKVKDNQMFSLNTAGREVANQLYLNMLTKSRGDRVNFVNRNVLRLLSSQSAIASSNERDKLSSSNRPSTFARNNVIQLSGGENSDSEDKYMLLDDGDSEEDEDIFRNGAYRHSSSSSSKNGLPSTTSEPSKIDTISPLYKSENTRKVSNILSRLQSLSSASNKSITSSVTIDLTHSPNPDEVSVLVDKGENMDSGYSSNRLLYSQDTMSTAGSAISKHISAISQGGLSANTGLTYQRFGFIERDAAARTESHNGKQPVGNANSLRTFDSFTESYRILKEKLDKVGQNLLSDTSGNVDTSMKSFNGFIKSASEQPLSSYNNLIDGDDCNNHNNDNNSNNINDNDNDDNDDDNNNSSSSSCSNVSYNNQDRFSFTRHSSLSSQSNIGFVDLTDDADDDSDEIEVLTADSITGINTLYSHNSNSNGNSNNSNVSKSKNPSSIISSSKAVDSAFYSSYIAEDDRMEIVMDNVPLNQEYLNNSNSRSNSNSNSNSKSNSRSSSRSNSNLTSIDLCGNYSESEKKSSTSNISLYTKVLRDTMSSLSSGRLPGVGPISATLNNFSQPAVSSSSSYVGSSIHRDNNKNLSWTSSSGFTQSVVVGDSLSRSGSLSRSNSTNATYNVTNLDASSNAFSILMSSRGNSNINSNANKQTNNDKAPKAAASSSAKEDMQLLDIVVTNPSDYEVVLLVDNRERHKEFVSGTMNDTNGEQVNLKVCSLPLGDFLWIAVPKSVFGDGNFLKDDKLTKNGQIGRSVIVLDYIIERKTMSDLSSSIMDDRYRNQQNRMKKKANISNCMYFIEGLTMSGDSYSVVSNNGLRKAMLETQVGNGFKIVRTRSIEHTVNVLKNMNKLIIDGFNEISQYPKSIQSYAKFYYNTKPHSGLYYPEATANHLFQHILYQVSHVSPNVINQLLKHFDTFNQFLKYFRSNDKNTVVNWLSGLRKIGTTDQKFGPALAEDLWNLFGEIY